MHRSAAHLATKRQRTRRKHRRSDVAVKTRDAALSYCVPRPVNVPVPRPVAYLTGAEDKRLQASGERTCQTVLVWQPCCGHSVDHEPVDGIGRRAAQWGRRLDCTLQHAERKGVEQHLLVASCRRKGKECGITNALPQPGDQSRALLRYGGDAQCRTFCLLTGGLYHKLPNYLGTRPCVVVPPRFLTRRVGCIPLLV